MIRHILNSTPARSLYCMHSAELVANQSTIQCNQAPHGAGFLLQGVALQMPGSVVLDNQGGDCAGYAKGDSLTCEGNTKGKAMNVCDCDWVAVKCGSAGNCSVDQASGIADCACSPGTWYGFRDSCYWESLK